MKIRMVVVHVRYVMWVECLFFDLLVISLHFKEKGITS